MITPHGEVETPVFMPVGTQATVKGMPQHLLEEMDARIILGNTYHIYLRPGADRVRRLGGLHKFMSWDRAILTDSGGFQVFSLNDLNKVSEEGVEFRSHLDGSKHLFTPESSIGVQIDLGADIIMAFDECTEHPATRERARSSMEMTLRWARRSKDAFEARKHEVPWESSRQSSVVSHQETGASLQPIAFSLKQNPNAIAHWEGKTQSLFGIVQGGMYADLRKESAERTVEIGFPGYAIGGLSVGESRQSTREMIEATLEHLPKDKPRYVMGVGYPEEIVEYAAMGVDMMDCVIPTRAARHGLLFTSEGRVNIKNAKYAEDQNPLDQECCYLRHLSMTAEPLGGLLNTAHNLAHYLDTMRRVRYAIKSGDISGLLSRARSKPSMADPL